MNLPAVLLARCQHLRIPLRGLYFLESFLRISLGIEVQLQSMTALRRVVSLGWLYQYKNQILQSCNPIFVMS